jgi:putative ABC transport system permease protein
VNANLFELAFASLRTRKAGFFGSWFALTLGTALIAMTGQALAASLGGDSAALIQTQSMAATTSVIAAFVTVFIVVSTFAFVAEQRGRELALLRLVGLTPAQVLRMFLAEAALLGALSAACGCVLGAASGPWFGRWLVAEKIAPDWFRIGFQPVALLVAAILGVGCAVAGAGTVAVRASRAKPVDALRDAAATTGRSMGVLRRLLGFGLLAAAVIAGYEVATGDPEYAVNPRKYAAVPLLFVGGFTLLSPMVLRPLARLGTRALGGFRAGPMLVRQNTLNSQRRAAGLVTPAALAIGLVAAVMCMQSAGVSTKVLHAEQSEHGEFAVTSTTGPGGTLTRATVDSLAAVPGAVTATLADVPIALYGTDGSQIDTFTAYAVTPGAMGTVFTPRVLQGSITGLGSDFLVVDNRAAQEDDLSIGRQVVVVPAGGDVRLRVRIGAIIQTGLSGDEVYISDTGIKDDGPVIAWVDATSHGSALSQNTLSAALAGQPARAEGEAVYFSSLAGTFAQQSQTATRVILGITVGYALLAVANTLIMASAGRRRELVTLQLIGATRRQLLGVVAGECLLSVCVGAVLATAAGAAVILTQRMAVRELVADAPTLMPWNDLCQAALVCLGVSVVAATTSTWRTTRDRIG